MNGKAIEQLINSCRNDLIEGSKLKDEMGYSDIIPKNPSIVVNYNLENKVYDFYQKHMEQSWPKAHMNLQYAKQGDNFYEVEKKLRSNELFDNFHAIYVHVFYNENKATPEQLLEFITQNFSETYYKVVVHVFFDYEDDVQAADNEAHLKDLNTAKEQKVFQYLFVYSNRLNNGRNWIGEDSSKIWRLMANVTAIMMSDTTYFKYGTNYTFSYNILAKPTKKIIQFCICRMLKNIINYEYDEKIPKRIEQMFSNKIRNLAKEKEGIVRFSEEDFYYLPSNRELQKENKDVQKSIGYFNQTYTVAASCYKAMLDSKIKKAKDINLQYVDFKKEIDDILSFFYLNGFIQNSHNEEEMYKNLEGILLCEAEVNSKGTYFKFICDYANEKISKVIIKNIFDIFKKQLAEKISNAKRIDKEIREICNANQLLINGLDKEINLEKYYKKVVDDYFVKNKEQIVKSIDQNFSFESLLHQLETVMLELFKSETVFYMSFEDEIAVRVQHDTAKKMFEEISQEKNIFNNICFNTANVQLEVDVIKSNDVILLLPPNSKLSEHKIATNYQKLYLSRQDFIERIDFYVLKYKEKAK